MKNLHEMLLGKRAVFFDLDGTLIDSIRVWNDVDERLAMDLAGTAPPREELRRFREESLRRFRGEPEPYLCYCAALKARFGTALTPRQVQERRSAIAQKMLREMDYKPGAAAFLRELKARGYILVLATTGRRSSVDIYRRENEKIAKEAPFDEIFDRIYTCEDVKAIKPDPEIYLRAMEDLSLPDEACLVFEDSLSGILAAKSAGLSVCAVYDPHSDPDREAIRALADWHVTSFADLVVL